MDLAGLGGLVDQRQRRSRDSSATGGSASDTYEIFEGTEQIQQLVIARAISGLRIE
jgi:hypothetical protein